MVWHGRITLILLAVIISVPIAIKTRQRPPGETLAGFSVASSAGGYVRVSGDVRYPGMCPTTANIVTNDVIKMAVPSRRLKTLAPAGVEGIPVVNGSAIRLTITPDGRGEVFFAAIPSHERILMGIPLDINAMNESDLDCLPGVGPVMAHRIVAYRQKNGGRMAVQELLNIEGIGEKRYEQIKKFF